MADPRTMPHDLVSRPWRQVAELIHCSHCLGVLPPGVDGACEVCGSGTPRGLVVTAGSTFETVGAGGGEREVLLKAGGWADEFARWARWPNV